MDITQTFILYREADFTGISGTGPVADGVTFPDGTTILRWRDVAGPNADRGVRPTTVVHESRESVTALHGHGGATYIVDGPAMSTCKHCARPILSPEPFLGWVHAIGPAHRLSRCAPDDSGKPYGYNAEPVGAECKAPCVGTNDPS